MAGQGQIFEYLARVFDHTQMDMQATYYQMVTLLTKPGDAFKSAYYRKRTKNQWARDDPAFVVVQAAFLIVATLAWAVALQVPIGIFSLLGVLTESVLLFWLLFGAAAATAGWWASNKYLRAAPHEQAVEQRVEWLYCFDIHCNAFFLLFLVLYVLQFFLLPLLGGSSFLALLCANTLWATAFGVYFYVSFLGYMALPFLDPNGCVVFLYPIGAVACVFVLAAALHPLGLGFNMTRVLVAHFAP